MAVPYDPFTFLEPAMRDMVERAHEQAWADHPELDEQFGDRGRFHARQDMAYHAVFLDAAATAGDQAFLDYVKWATEILEARNVSAQVLANALQRFADLKPPGEALLRQAAAQAIESKPASQPPAANDLTTALLSGEPKSVLAQLGPCSEPQQHALATQRLMESMESVGDLWAAGSISVAEEHLASATCQRVLASLEEAVEPQPHRGKVLLACVEGNLHDLGLRASADQCAAHGWDVVFLGADVPTETLQETVKEHAPDAIFLSAALATQVMATRQAVQALRELGQEQVYVGGHAFRDGGEMWRLTGAQGFGLAALEILK